MIVVVATSEDGVPGVRARLRAHGVGVDGGAGVPRVEAPGPVRRLVLARVDDDEAAERLAADLRAEGELAVARPDGGARLDAWVRHTRPITFGDRLSTCFAWSEHARDGLPGLIELVGGGFGSGQHPTTRLVVEDLLRRIRGGERVLDVGCGNGVLGLAALALGASSVVAVDIDAGAVEATRRNAVLNGVDGRLGATLAPLGEIAGTFDVLVANIGRSAVVELAPDLVRLLSPHGALVISGISPPQCALVAGFLPPLVEVERRTAGEWSVVVLAHPDQADARRAATGAGVPSSESSGRDRGGA